MDQINYRLIRSRKRIASTTISVGPKGVIVRAPFWIPDWVIKQFVSQKQDWIKKQLNKNPPHQDKSLKHGDTILFFGEELILNIESSTSPGRPRTEIESGVLRLSVPSHFSEEVRSQAVRKALTGLLREKGIEHITGRVNHFSQIVNVSYSKITLKNVSSLWGSCSARNNLNFNQHLLMAPPEVIDYVVVHEVSHLVHRDHSSRFWALVRSLDPDYKLHRLWLRKNQKKLSL